MKDYQDGALREELSNCKLELQIAQQRIVELSALLQANDYQSICQTVLSRIRHEINNPLTAVLQAQLILRRPENLSEETIRRIETIEVSPYASANFSKTPSTNSFLVSPVCSSRSRPIRQHNTDLCESLKIAHP